MAGWGNGGDRNRALRRVLRLMTRCEGLRYAPPLEELATELQCSTRTIRRDFALLESAGVHVPMFRFNERLVA